MNEIYRDHKIEVWRDGDAVVVHTPAPSRADTVWTGLVAGAILLVGLAMVALPVWILAAYGFSSWGEAVVGGIFLVGGAVCLRAAWLAGRSVLPADRVILGAGAGEGGALTLELRILGRVIRRAALASPVRVVIRPAYSRRGWGFRIGLVDASGRRRGLVDPITVGRPVTKALDQGRAMAREIARRLGAEAVEAGWDRYLRKAREREEWLRGK